MKMRRYLKILLLIVICLSIMFVFTGCQTVGEATPGDAGNDSIVETLISLLGSRQSSVQIVALLTILSVLPSILMMFTSFTRTIIVLSFTKNAMGMQQMPPNQVVIGLALMLTFFIMAPVADEIKTQAYEPYIEGRIEIEEATDRALIPVKSFMLRQTFTGDLDTFITMSGETFESLDDISLTVLMPAFLTSEIKRGFMMGFFIYLPFIVIDMVVASVLMSMGMMMLPPTVIALPFKVLLFIAVDGWMLTVQTLVESFVAG